MTILCIETSTTCCSAAICIDGVSMAFRENIDGANHARELPVFIDELLREAQQNAWKLDAVALSQGPGSYTGLRIGASTAKGVCYGMNIPLIPVDTLQVLCAAATAHMGLQDGAILCPMLDARRMEVYTAMYDANTLERKDDVVAKVMDEHSFEDELSTSAIYFFGNGAEKCKSVITSSNARFIDGILPRASFMGRLAELQSKLGMLDMKAIAYYEPFYLKEFVPAASHIKGLN